MLNRGILVGIVYVLLVNELALVLISLLTTGRGFCDVPVLNSSLD